VSTASADRTAIRFADFELDLRTRVLRKHGMRIRCQEQPLEVLTALAERPGEIVTREELRRRVWPQDTFVDFDHALNTAVKKIRAALNDDADAPRYIETVPRRGYRFVAPVSQSGQASGDSGPHETVVPAGPDRRRIWEIVCFGALVVVIAALAWKAVPWRRSDAFAAPEFRRLTFDLPELGDARFTPDGASVVYTAAKNSGRHEIYTQRLDASAPAPVGLADSVLLSVSSRGDVAILDGSSQFPSETSYLNLAGTLARVPLGGGAPRQLLPDVEAADWSPDGQLLVVRRVAHKSRLEFPVGKVLYQSSGWIASPRFSPDGRCIGFLDHPVAPDDRGTVSVVDLNGNVKVLSGFWETARGLAWNAPGNELWFTAARSGVSRSLYAVDPNGHERRVWSVAGGLSLQDISRDGRVLLARDNERLGIVYLGAGEKEPRDLSWQDWSIAMDLSPDGKQLLFGEEGENSGFSYQVGLRGSDGSPPVMLGAGAAQSLSPDGRWALSVVPPPNDQLLLLPIGPGTPKTLERGAVEHYWFAGAKWFPDSRGIVFTGSEPGRGPRCYKQSVEGGGPQPFTPEGVLLCSVSPTRSIMALTEDHRVLLYASDSAAKPNREFRLRPEEMPSGWSLDGKYLYLSQTRQLPITIVRFDVSSGVRLPWKVLPAPPPGTEIKLESVIVTPDGQSFAYTYSHHLSDLYTVAGLK
jgi:DNA-binding winged helix-turn-helix (wHTH) protein/Tol biopolymer transport system component